MPQKSRRNRRPPTTRYVDHPPGALTVGRGLLRRTDLFDGSHYSDSAADERELGFWGARRPEPVYVAVDWPANLGGPELALLVALVAWHTPDHLVRVRRQDGTTLILTTGTPRQIAQMVFGARHIRGEEYALLGLTRDQLLNPTSPPGALQRLSAVRVLAHSKWLHPNGQIEDIGENFALIPYWVYRQNRNTGRERLYYQLSEPIIAGRQPIPAELLHNLGPRDASGLRLSLHCLSHAPIADDRREIGLGRLVRIVRPPDSRHPDRYPGRYRRYVRSIVDRIDRADPHHHWAVTDARSDPLGKIVIARTPDA